MPHALGDRKRHSLAREDGLGGKAPPDRLLYQLAAVGQEGPIGIAVFTHRTQLFHMLEIGILG